MVVNLDPARLIDGPDLGCILLAGEALVQQSVTRIYGRVTWGHQVLSVTRGEAKEVHNG